MRPHHLLIAAVFLLGGCGAPAPDLPVGTAPTVAVTTPAPTAVGIPVSISIPALGITDEVVPVGLAADGQLEVPAVEESGWFDKGPRPGQPGGSLIAGHVDWKGTPGALGRIGELRSGDRVIVKDADGIERVFGVYDVQTIPKVDYAKRTVPIVFGPRSTSDLELVTCGGRIVGHWYDSNVVVSARLATTRP